MATYSSLSQGSFGLATAWTGYLAYRTMSPPQNRRKMETTLLDNIGGDKFFLAAAFYRMLFLSLSIWQGLVCCDRSFAPSANLQFPISNLFLTWNKVSAATFAFIWAGSWLRLRSFKELDKDFTFELHAPDKLNTHGLYKYIQHPSYTGMTALHVAGFWFFRCNGVLATVLPESILKHQSWWNILIPSVPLVAGCIMIPMRVKDEEAMLKKKFGKQWEEWNARTARFLPFLY